MKNILFLPPGPALENDHLRAVVLRLGESLTNERTETVVLATTAWRPFAFEVDASPAPPAPQSPAGDPELARAIVERARQKDLPASISSFHLDPGTEATWKTLFPGVVPRLVLVGTAHQSPERAKEFGEAVREAADLMGRRVALITVGSLGLDHRAMAGGVDTALGPAFDEAVIGSLEERRGDQILEGDPSLWIEGRPDAELGHLFCLLGAAASGARAERLAYWRTPGAGYACLRFDPLAVDIEKPLSRPDRPTFIPLMETPDD